MKTAAIAILAPLALCAAPAAHAFDHGPEARRVQTASAQALGLSRTFFGYPAAETTAQRIVAEHFDLYGIAQGILAQEWERADSTLDERAASVLLVGELLAEHIARSFSSLGNAQAGILGTIGHGEEDGAPVTVNTLVKPLGEASVSVDWRLRPSHGGIPGVVDVFVNGSSMVLAVQAELQRTLSSQGAEPGMAQAPSSP